LQTRPQPDLPLERDGTRVKTRDEARQARLEVFAPSGFQVLLFAHRFNVIKTPTQEVKGTIMTQVDLVQVDELVREIARALVDEPDAVEVEAVNRDENTVLRLRVAAQDVGKVIGKQGRTARSVRTILGAVSMKLHHRFTLDILEEDDEG
jgi:predicted RNA-binding protein YlqC (UPF0109 family)